MIIVLCYNSSDVYGIIHLHSSYLMGITYQFITLFFFVIGSFINYSTLVPITKPLNVIGYHHLNTYLSQHMSG